MIKSAGLLLLVLSAMNIVYAEGDAEAGKAKAAVCGACHGMNGISPNPIWPNLAGQQDQYLIAQMKAFRSGERKNAMMSPMAVGLTDDDIDNLAAFYSQLKCE